MSSDRTQSEFFVYTVNGKARLDANSPGVAQIDAKTSLCELKMLQICECAS